MLQGLIMEDLAKVLTLAVDAVPSVAPCMIMITNGLHPVTFTTCNVGSINWLLFLQLRPASP